MPRDIVVRKSWRIAVLMAVQFAAVGLFLLIIHHDKLVDGLPDRYDLLFLALVGMLFGAAYSGVASAWNQNVVLVAFERGLFLPRASPDLIPWCHVEHVRRASSGTGMSVAIFLSRDFAASLERNWLQRQFWRLNRRLDGYDWLCENKCNYGTDAIVHVIDDWIRRERGQPIKPRYEPTMSERLIERLGGRA